MKMNESVIHINIHASHKYKVGEERGTLKIAYRTIPCAILQILLKRPCWAWGQPAHSGMAASAVNSQHPPWVAVSRHYPLFSTLKITLNIHMWQNCKKCMRMTNTKFRIAATWGGRSIQSMFCLGSIKLTPHPLLIDTHWFPNLASQLSEVYHYPKGRQRRQCGRIDSWGNFQMCMCYPQWVCESRVLYDLCHL